MENDRNFFEPRTLAKLSGLQLRARRIVEGYVAGLHRSPYRGFSVEFAEHREYAPGDDLRYLDWKVLGRTDKFYLKQYEDETNLIGYLVLDASESMQYQGPDSPLSKLEYAQCLAAALGLAHSAAAGRGGPGDIRPADPVARAAQQQRLAPEAAAARSGRRRTDRQDGDRADLSRAGGTVAQTRSGDRPQRSVR